MLCVRTAPAGNYRFLCRVFRRCKRRSSFLCCLRGDSFRLLLAVCLLRVPVRKQIAQRCFVHLCIQRVLSCAECSLFRCFRIRFRALLRLALHLLRDLLRFRSDTAALRSVTIRSGLVILTHRRCSRRVLSSRISLVQLFFHIRLCKRLVLLVCLLASIRTLLRLVLHFLCGLLRLVVHLLCDLLRFRSNAIGCIVHAAQCTGSHTAQRSTRGEVLRRAHRIDKRIIVSCGENLFISVDRCPL